MLAQVVTRQGHIPFFIYNPAWPPALKAITPAIINVNSALRAVPHVKLIQAPALHALSAISTHLLSTAALLSVQMDFMMVEQALVYSVRAVARPALLHLFAFPAPKERSSFWVNA